ncbi:MAG: response regulator [Planctomycetaceae bacterium]
MHAPQPPSPNKSRRGFTLVELVVVILLLGIIAAIAAPRMFDTADRARENSTRQSLTIVRNAIELYRVENGVYPGDGGTQADFIADIGAHLKTPFPRNQLSNAPGDGTITIQTSGNPLTVGGNTDWKYDNVTGEFIINTSGFEAFYSRLAVSPGRSFRETASKHVRSPNGIEPMDQARPHVLVAEDNPVMSNVLRFNLERGGFRVTVCGDGRAAADALLATQFDVVITDHQMPRMSGVELCRFVRADERHRETPLFLCSAKGLELEVTRLTDELRLTGIFYKPFSPRDVVASAQKALSATTTG